MANTQSSKLFPAIRVASVAWLGTAPDERSFQLSRQSSCNEWQGGKAACERCDMIKFYRTAVTYGTLRKECLEAIRQWPGCETVAGIQLIRDNSPAGFAARVTLYGRADKKVADRAMICVQREKRRHYRLTE